MTNNDSNNKTASTQQNNINQDNEPSSNQQVSNESALDMMKGLHEHENHEDFDQED